MNEQRRLSNQEMTLVNTTLLVNKTKFFMYLTTFITIPSSVSSCQIIGIINIYIYMWRDSAVSVYIYICIHEIPMTCQRTFVHVIITPASTLNENTHVTLNNMGYIATASSSMYTHIHIHIYIDGERGGRRRKISQFSLQ